MPDSTLTVLQRGGVRVLVVNVVGMPSTLALIVVVAVVPAVVIILLEHRAFERAS